MSKKKLIAKILKRPTDMRFEEVETLLTQHSFFSNTQGTSHRVYKNEEGMRITIAIKGGQTVKRIYLEEIIKVLELEPEAEA